MKLKLETSESITVISVSEEIQTHQLPVLKAGLQKMLQKGTSSIVIDLSHALIADPQVIPLIEALIPWGLTQGLQLEVRGRSAVQAPGGAAIAASGVAPSLTPREKLMFDMQQLEAKLKNLSAVRDGLTQNLKSTEGTGDWKELPRRTSELKRRNQMVERFVKGFKEDFAIRFEKGPPRKSEDELYSVIRTYLLKEGILQK